jgi:hypothetical protein
MSKLQTKLQFLFMILKTTNDSHIKLKMEIYVEVCTLLENLTKIHQNPCSMEV